MHKFYVGSIEIVELKERGVANGLGFFIPKVGRTTKRYTIIQISQITSIIFPSPSNNLTIL
jgi:hypothetical protein